MSLWRGLTRAKHPTIRCYCVQGQSRLEDCIRSYFAPEELTGSNKYDCDTCRNVTGEKQVCTYSNLEVEDVVCL